MFARWWNSTVSEEWNPVGAENVKTLDGLIRAHVFEYPNTSNLVWYDPGSEQIIQDATINWSDWGNDYFGRRRIRIVPKTEAE